jgi:hypothetical protein
LKTWDTGCDLPNVLHVVPPSELDLADTGSVMAEVGQEGRVRYGSV